jgi:hypothetical protein
MMDIEKLGDETLARKLIEFFEALDYPFLGATLRLEERYPLVQLWHDTTESTRIIACAKTPDQMHDAQHYAETMAAVEALDSPMPVWGHAICSETGGVFLAELRAEADAISELERLLSRPPRKSNWDAGMLPSTSEQEPG